MKLISQQSITRDREVHFIIIKVFYQEDIIILNAYIPNNRAIKHVKQKLIELQEVDKFIILVRVVNTPSQRVDRK